MAKNTAIVTRRKSAAKPAAKPATRRRVKTVKSRKVASPPAASSAASPVAAAAARFPIIGIGASAGGLEALEQFFGTVPADCGMAFVVIQHLDPTRTGVMPELLARITPLKVMQAGDRMKVKPGCVYVIPSNKDLSILHGMLLLLDPVAARGIRLPIDFFLRALALDARDQAIGVILSGMGSDGALGARAIHAQGGLVLVQTPDSAKFDSMPRSVLDAGQADIAAPAAELPKRIMDYLGQVAMGKSHGDATDSLHDSPAMDARSSFDNIVILLRERSGNDFSLYKKSTVYRRVERRMAIHRVATIALYVRFLRENPQELDLLFKELLIGVTAFFRDPAAWVDVQEQVMTPLLKAASKKTGNLASKATVLRAWVAGCSTGEEAYTLAMVFREALDRVKPLGRIALQIFATDIDPDAIDQARRGCYPANIAADVSEARLARFFVKEGAQGAYRIGKDIREMVIFAPHNVFMDAPFTKLDILCCRNLLIYFNAELQAKILPLFHYSLNAGGILFLGSAETTGVNSRLFDPLKSRWRLYRNSAGVQHRVELDFPSRQKPLHALPSDVMRARPAAANLQTLADQMLLQQFCPCAVLVSREGDILYINGRTGDYLEPASGKANWNIYVMARGGLRQAIAAAMPKVLRGTQSVVVSGIEVGARRVDITVQLLVESPALQGTVMIVFAEVMPLPAATATRGRARSVERELRQAHAQLQSMAEEMQASKEELKSANEELQSTNEELQSTNEELTTSKEELQSLNEELQAVNAELQAKVDDLSSANSDLNNLLNSSDIATVFLDNVLHVRRFTPQATRIFKLIAGDAGRPLSDIVTDLDYAALQDDAREVLRTLLYCEKQITTRDGRWFMTRIMPYRTVENVIDGVVITFTDISVAKHLEAELRKARELAPPAGNDLR